MPTAAKSSAPQPPARVARAAEKEERARSLLQTLARSPTVLSSIAEEASDPQSDDSEADYEEVETMPSLLLPEPAMAAESLGPPVS